MDVIPSRIEQLPLLPIEGEFNPETYDELHMTNCIYHEIKNHVKDSTRVITVMPQQTEHSRYGVSSGQLDRVGLMIRPCGENMHKVVILLADTNQLADTHFNLV